MGAGTALGVALDLVAEGLALAKDIQARQQQMTELGREISEDEIKAYLKQADAAAARFQAKIRAAGV